MAKDMIDKTIDFICLCLGIEEEFEAPQTSRFGWYIHKSLITGKFKAPKKSEDQKYAMYKSGYVLVEDNE